MKRIWRIGLVVALTVVGGGITGTTAASAEKPPLAVTAANYDFPDLPNRIAPDKYKVELDNPTDEPHHIIVLKLTGPDTDATRKEVIEAADNEGEGFNAKFVGGVDFVPPESSAMGGADLSRRGRYVAICFLETADGTPHYKLGMLDFFRVS